MAMAHRKLPISVSDTAAFMALFAVRTSYLFVVGQVGFEPTTSAEVDAFVYGYLHALPDFLIPVRVGLPVALILEPVLMLRLFTSVSSLARLRPLCRIAP